MLFEQSFLGQIMEQPKIYKEM